jgi:hypothetical protein
MFFRSYIFYVLAAFLLFFDVVYAVGLYQTHRTYFTRVISDVSKQLTPQPETFTELYIDNHTSLPKHPQIGDTIAFSFTINNLEHKTMKYPYVVSLKPVEGDPIAVASGSVTLDHEQLQAVKIEHTLIDVSGRSQMVVTLTDLSQSVHFWLDIASDSAQINDEE